MSLLKRPAKKKYRLLIDISSHVISVTILSVTDNNIDIAWNYHENIRFSTSTDKAENEKAILTSLMQVFLELQNRGLQQSGAQLSEFEYFECILSSAWLKNSIIDISYQEDKEFVVTEELLNELQDTKLDAYISGSGAEISILYQERTQLRLNGYLVNNYQDKEVKYLSFHILFSSINSSLQEKIDEMCKKLLPKINMIYTPKTAVIAGLVPTAKKENCLIVDFDDQTTELIAIKNGEIVDLSLISAGMGTFVKTVADATNLPIKQVYSTLYSEELFESFTADKENSLLINNSKKGFRKNFFQTATIDRLLSGIHTIYLYHHRPLGEFWNTFIQDILCTGNSFDVQVLEIAKLDKEQSTLKATDDSFPQTATEKGA